MDVVRRCIGKKPEMMDGITCAPSTIVLTAATLPEYIATNTQGGFQKGLSSTQCPIALFLRKKIKSEYAIFVGSSSIVLSSTHHGPRINYESLLPYEAMQWIATYDKWYLMFQDYEFSGAKNALALKQRLVAKMSELDVVVSVPKVCIEM